MRRIENGDGSEFPTAVGGTALAGIAGQGAAQNSLPSPFSYPTFTHWWVFALVSTASQTFWVSRASRNVGCAGCFFA